MPYVLLTLLNTAGAKDPDSCESDDYAQADDLRRRRRYSSIDGLTVCQRSTTLFYLMIMPSL